MMMSNDAIDRVLIIWFWIFAFTALIFEPISYFGCYSADGISVSADWRISHCEEGFILDVWRLYGSWDPLFIRVPPFLRIMCGIEVFIFGPCYTICAICLSMKVPPRWFAGFALFFSGALFYSTVVYFAYEVLFAPEAFTNMTMVILVNIPWSIIPMILAYRAMSMISAVQTFGPSTPRGVIGCFNTDKWN
jgi:hypothetical protein